MHWYFVYNTRRKYVIPQITVTYTFRARFVSEAWSARWWMAHYKAKTPKRHIAWSNSEGIRLLDLGKLRNFDLKSSEYQKHRTAKVTINKTTGKKQFSGKRKALKDSQHLGSCWLLQISAGSFFGEKMKPEQTCAVSGFNFLSFQLELFNMIAKKRMCENFKSCIYFFLTLQVAPGITGPFYVM